MVNFSCCIKPNQDSRFLKGDRNIGGDDECLLPSLSRKEKMEIEKTEKDIRKNKKL